VRKIPSNGKKAAENQLKKSAAAANKQLIEEAKREIHWAFEFRPEELYSEQRTDQESKVTYWLICEQPKSIMLPEAWLTLKNNQIRFNETVTDSKSYEKFISLIKTLYNNKK
jgi:hypothetical protein